VPVPGLTHLEVIAIQVTGQQTGVNPCGLPFAFPPSDQSGPDHLFQQGIAGLDGWQPQRETRGLELAAEHEMGETPT